MNEVEKKGIGKSKVGLVVAVVVCVILAISSVWLYLRVDSLETEVSILQTEVNSLTNKKNTLQNQVNSLTIEDDDLQDEVDDLTKEISQLEDRYDLYVANHHYSDSEYAMLYDDAQFHFYYVKPEQKFGVYDLDDELYGWEWHIPYEEGVFDCSEMSAYLEWYLENEGWHTIIVVGDSPFGSGRHAWLVVEASEGEYMPVESTTGEIVWWENQYFDNYFEYDRSFETIQEAIAYDESDFDWWK